MKNHDLSHRYAAAIFELAEEKGLTESVFNRLKSVREAMNTERRILIFFLSPIISHADKHAFVEKNLIPINEGLALKFVNLLVEKHRVEILPEIVDEFEALLNEKNGIAKATLVSAHPLSDELLRPFQAALERFAGKKVLLKTRVESELIGGVQIRINNYLVDVSLRNRLDQLRYLLQTMRVA
jgi:F-type H+-transporting ATPase subunit delta